MDMGNKGSKQKESTVVSIVKLVAELVVNIIEAVEDNKNSDESMKEFKK